MAYQNDDTGWDMDVEESLPIHDPVTMANIAGYPPAQQVEIRAKLAHLHRMLRKGETLQHIQTTMQQQYNVAPAQTNTLLNLLLQKPLLPDIGEFPPFRRDDESDDEPGPPPMSMHHTNPPVPANG